MSAGEEKQASFLAATTLGPTLPAQSQDTICTEYKAATPSGLCNSEVLAKVLSGLNVCALPLSSRFPHLHKRRELILGTGPAPHMLSFVF